MTWPGGRPSRRVIQSSILLLLAGCAGGLGGSPPAHLYRVSPTRIFPPNLPRRRQQLLVDAPVAPAGLDTERIALSRSAVSIDYFADSEWTDRAPLLVQTALLQSFENSNAINAIDRQSTGLRADLILKLELRHFEAVYESPGGPPEVWVATNLRLVDPSSGEIVARTSFEGRQRASANNVPSIVAAFDEALGGVLKSIVVWAVTNPAWSRKRR
ncbi:MAG: membrane integrity-associated transporter subunit PqiC [Alphaproteobacteria bacterium]|nr:membrane integrity-associated transporter subunit PqiC [Alphaproteobacteria bacterium]